MSESTTIDPNSGATATPDPGATIPKGDNLLGTATPTPGTESTTSTEQTTTKPPSKDWREVRLGEVSAKNRTLDAENKRMAAELARLKAQPKLDAEGKPIVTTPPVEPGLTEADVDARAEMKAIEALFNKKCDDIVVNGKKEFTDFEAKLQVFKDLGSLPMSVVEATMELEADGVGSASAILYHLASDPNEAIRIFKLSPSRQGAALAKLASGVPKPQASSVPEPVGRGGLKGPANAGTKNPDDMPYDEWEKWRDKQPVSARRRA